MESEGRVFCFFIIPLSPPLEKGEVIIPLSPPLEKGEVIIPLSPPLEKGEVWAGVMVNSLLGLSSFLKRGWENYNLLSAINGNLKVAETFGSIKNDDEK